VLAIQRNGEVLRSKLSEVRLAFGDSLLLQGPRNEINRLRGDEDFIVLEEVASPSMRKGKIPIALAVIAAVVGLAALNVLPIMTSAIIGCIVMVLTRCITLEEAYDAVDWRVIFLLASVIPLGVAMHKSGAAELIAVQSVWLFGGMNPVVILAVFYILTAILTECMSNNASAALLAPIAISTAVEMGVDPKPLLMAVTFAASTSFATPVGYQTNMMIYNPGGYRFTDFMKVGLPLIVLFCITSVYFIPKFWPF
jgi:di/tricarboxylate transporter